MRIVLPMLLLSLLTLAKAQKTCKWMFKADSSIYSSPVIHKEKLFIGDNAANFYVLNKTNGEVLWTRKLNGAIRSKPVINQQLVMINDASGKLYALNKSTGEEVWNFSMGKEMRVDMWDYYLSSPVVDNDVVYIGSGDKHIYAIDAVKGTLIWKYKTNGIVHAAPIIYENKLFIGSFDGFFYALDKNVGVELWKFKTVGDVYFPQGAIQKAACVFENKVIFGSRDYNTYALDVETGRGHWNYKERGSWVIATPLIYGKQLFVGTSDTHRFLAMNASNGEINWTLPLNMRVYASAVVYENDVYFGCFNGKVYRANANSGESELVFQTSASKQNYMKLFKSETEFVDGIELYGSNSKQIERQILDLGAILSTPVVEDRVMYFGDANGYLYALPLN